MKYDLSWLLSEAEQKPDLKYLHFWGHRPRKDGQPGAACFSQWWHAPFTIDQIAYPTAEHWMMAENFKGHPAII